MKMTLDLNESTISLPFKWTDKIDNLLAVHPVDLEVYYTEKVGVDSWESTFVVYNVYMIDGKTFIYSRTVGDHDVNDGIYHVLDWDQKIPERYTEIRRYEKDVMVNVAYLYPVQLRSIEEDVFLGYFKGTKDDLNDTLDGPSGVVHPNGFQCVHN